MQTWLVGSAPDCDLVIDGPLVSGRHCLLRRTPDGWRIDDLNSSNGTYVNGRKIGLQAFFLPDDRVTLSTAVPLHLPSEAPRFTRSALTVGRAAENDVVFDYPMVSLRHALVRATEAGVKIDDLKSTNGLYLGTRADRVTSAVLQPDDVLYFGTFKCPAERLTALLREPAAGGELPKVDFGDRVELLLGRDPQCDVVLDFPMVSRHHARITRDARGLFVHDLHSSNGTYVNGRRVEGPTPVKLGDVVALGSYGFLLTAEGRLARTAPRGDIALHADQICVDVPGKRLLHGVSLTILPSEFVGLMGLSGAGKSTLIGALNGYKRPTEGRVLLNGLDLYEHFDQFRGHLGYVPQDDIIHADLTVGEALYYSARLRLPSDFTDDEIRRRIAAVLAQLAMQGTENVLIGSQDRKGISGGQRKRVNLAMELMTDPSVLFLDEPTSGLSSEDALIVMKLLRRLADDGKTILLTIHQPSLEVYRLLDHLVVMAQDPGANKVGRLVYFGPAYPDALDFFQPTEGEGKSGSPDVLLRGLAGRPTSQWVARYEASDLCRQFVRERAAPAANVESHPNPKVTRTRGLAPWWTLVRRAATIKARDHWNTAVLMIQAPVIAGLICLVFGKKAAQELTADHWPDAARAVSTTLFLTVLSAVWFGCSNAAREIIGEWPVYRRERMVNLGLGSYVGSKFTVLVASCVVQCAVLLGIVHAYCGLEGPWLRTYCVMLLAAGVGVGIGLTISALAKSSEMAIACLPLVILPMVILGGTLQPLHEMNAIPRKLSALMPSRWAFEAALLVESRVRPMWTPPQVSPSGQVAAAAIDDGSDEARDMAEEWFPRSSHRWGSSAAMTALAVMLATTVAAVAGLLRLRDTH